ncbi:hypothetical protein ebD122 [Aromatoleum aromaticum EbN1]|uniref:Uncharacterized protein n=1 Tax=Aromatoleum aromaticum (strain DSM 19018 / LMG 30748 / EbN1) TaxID=76114 RepID=Q5NYA0_AROAE|nr:hypothetical protein ebD122 [Aromatoleum aromaticum EbN1]
MSAVCCSLRPRRPTRGCGGAHRSRSPICFALQRASFQAKPKGRSVLRGRTGGVGFPGPAGSPVHAFAGTITMMLLKPEVSRFASHLHTCKLCPVPFPRGEARREREVK